MLPPDYFTSREDRLLQLLLELYFQEDERNVEMENIDCYFYSESHQMNASIPSCSYHKKLGYCPCGNCKKYIKKSDANKIIRSLVDKEGE